jgi:hypothetical protein
MSNSKTFSKWFKYIFIIKLLKNNKFCFIICALIYLLKENKMNKVRDGLSKWEPNMLETRPLPYKTNPVIKKPAFAKDSLEISKEKLKQEALDRLRHTSKFTVESPAGMVIRVGKYMFLAAALPPYILLYRIPKWVLVEIAPVAMKLTLTPLKYIGNKLQNRLLIMQQKLSQFLQRLQKTAKGLIQPVFDLGLHIQNVLQRMRSQVVVFFNGIKKGVSFQKISQMPAQFGKGLKKKWNQKAMQLQNQIGAFFSPIKHSFHWLKALPKKMALRRLLSNKKMKQGVNHLSKGLELKFERAKKQAHQMTDWLLKQSQRPFSALKAFFKPYADQIKSAFRKIPFKKAKSFLQERKKKTKQWLQSKRAAVGNKIQLTKISRFIPPGLYTWIPTRLRSVLKQWFELVYHSSYFQMLVKAFKLGLTGFEKSVKGCFWVFDKSIESCQYAKQKTFSFLRWLDEQVQTGLAFAGRLIRRGIYWTLVGIIMVSLIIMEGFQTLGSLTSRFHGWARYHIKRTFG